MFTHSKNNLRSKFGKQGVIFNHNFEISFFRTTDENELYQNVDGEKKVAEIRWNLREIFNVHKSQKLVKERKRLGEVLSASLYSK